MGTQSLGREDAGRASEGSSAGAPAFILCSGSHHASHFCVADDDISRFRARPEKAKRRRGTWHPARIALSTTALAEPDSLHGDCGATVRRPAVWSIIRGRLGTADPGHQGVGGRIQGMKRGAKKAGGKPFDGKNPHAAALGRLGGLKGGRARAAALTPQERRTIASMAAQARWGKNRG